jgi:OOP family OmpA-OmpF porin
MPFTQAPHNTQVSRVKSFNVFGRLGVNRLTAKGTLGAATYKESDTKALFGVGVGYEFTPTAAVRFEVQRPESDTTNMSVGLAFKF